MKNEYVLASPKKHKKNQTVEAVGLLPCPFCGGEAEIRGLRENDVSEKWNWYYPTCTTIGCPGVVDEQDEQGGTCCDCKTVKDAIKLWNTRAT